MYETTAAPAEFRLRRDGLPVPDYGAGCGVLAQWLCYRIFRKVFVN